jgi:hypothetical protein
MPIDADIVQLHISPYTLGEAIKDKRMWVDTYQRNYAWLGDHIRDLYEDFQKVINQGAPAEHFLGSIVVVSTNGRAKIVDGQQRLATTTILFAAMRDYFFSVGDKEKATAYQTQYLTSINEDTLKPEPHLMLNTVDNLFFLHRIVISPDAPDRQIEESKEPSLTSHKLICDAATIAKETILRIVDGLPSAHALEQISKWKDFILQRARIIWIVVPDDGTAYSVFETMNDRGLRLSATDLLKNLLFALSKEDAYQGKVQEYWFKMAGNMEGSGQKDAVLTYVRHLWISSRTKATTNDLYKVIKRNIKDKDDALTFAKQLYDSSSLYTALLSSQHELWHKYPEEIAEDVYTLNQLRLITVRPLLLSGIDRFKDQPDVLRKFMRSLVNWSVRFLVAGRLGSGTLEEKYGEVARKLRSGTINTVDKVRKELIDVIPPDESFKNLFREMTVSQVYLQRYYLRALEAVERLDKDGLEPIKGKHNIEHVMPKNPEKAYKHIAPETIKAYTNRLGNLALIKAKDNVLIGDSDFAVKKPILTISKILLTAAIGKDYDKWGPEQIATRQGALAELALKTWPIKVL